MTAPQPRQRHHIERITVDEHGQTIDIKATRPEGGIRFFETVEAAHQEASKLGGRAAGYRVMTTFVDAQGNPCAMRITGNYNPASPRT